MILALVGQFKQLSHMYPENFQVTSTGFKPMTSVTSAKVTLIIIKFSLDISSTLLIIKLQSQCRSSWKHWWCCQMQTSSCADASLMMQMYPSATCNFLFKWEQGWHYRELKFHGVIWSNHHSLALIFCILYLQKRTYTTL